MVRPIATSTKGENMLHIKKEGNGLIAKLRLPVVAVLAIGLVASATPSHAAQTAPKQIRILYATAEGAATGAFGALGIPFNIAFSFFLFFLFLFNMIVF